MPPFFVAVFLQAVVPVSGRWSLLEMAGLYVRSCILSPGIDRNGSRVAKMAMHLILRTTLLFVCLQHGSRKVVKNRKGWEHFITTCV